ncbi:uncharacterized protein LOC144669522 [Cetorhinus maximus]
MRTLILLCLCALAAVCLGAPKEFIGPSEKEETFMDKQSANNFVRRKRHTYGYYHHVPSYESVREIYKSPAEVNREYCDGDDNCGKGYPYAAYGKGYSYAGYYGQQRPYYYSAKH